MAYKGYRAQVTKRDFVILLANDLGIRHSDASYIINRMFGLLTAAMRRGDKISLNKFGNFEPVKRHGTHPGFDFRNGRHYPVRQPYLDIEFRLPKSMKMAVRKLPVETIIKK